MGVERVVTKFRSGKEKGPVTVVRAAGGGGLPVQLRIPCPVRRAIKRVFVGVMSDP